MMRAVAFGRVVVACALASALIFGLGGIALAFPALAAITYTAITAVNVRSGPGLDYDIVGIIRQGDTISGEAAAGGWVPVAYQSKTRYVSATYLRAGSSTPTTTPTATVTATTSASASAKPTVSTTPTTTPTVTATSKPTVSTTPTTSTTPTGTPKPTASASSTPSTAHTITPTVTATAKPTVSTTPTTSTTPTGTPKPTASASSTPSTTPSNTASATPSASPSVSVTPKTIASTSPTPAPSPSTTTPLVLKVTTASVNVRSGPSIDDPVIQVLPKGSAVQTTGRISGSFSEVVLLGASRWISTVYLANPTTGSLPAIVARAVTTDVLALRATPSITAASSGLLSKGTVVALSGIHTASYSQVVWKSKLRWVLTGYLKLRPVTAGPVVPSLPASKGMRYAAADGVRVLATPETNASVVDTVPAGTVLLITGPTKSGFSQVIYAGALRWISTKSLATKPPTATPPVTQPPATGENLGSVSLNKTNAYCHVIVKEIRVEFTQVKTMYGWRASSAYSSDHPHGRAIDIMIPSYKTNKALGDAIAAYLITNHERLHINYIIWRQRNYRMSRGTWVKMADRGSPTQNHMDHVHVSVFDVP